MKIVGGELGGKLVYELVGGQLVHEPLRRELLQEPVGGELLYKPVGGEPGTKPVGQCGSGPWRSQTGLYTDGFTLVWRVSERSEADEESA
jgi:hypothetical protein